MRRPWLTPEEMEVKRQRKQKVIQISILLIAIFIGAGITILLNL